MRYSKRSTEPYRTIRIDSANDSNDSHDSPSTRGKPQTTNKVNKLDEALGVLTELQPRKPSVEPSRPSSEAGTPSSSEKAGIQSEEAKVSLRLRQVLEAFMTRQRTTPKQLGQLLGIKGNTACEHLRNAERLGLARRVRRGLYLRVDARSKE